MTLKEPLAYTTAPPTQTGTNYCEEFRSSTIWLDRKQRDNEYIRIQ